MTNRSVVRGVGYAAVALAVVACKGKRGGPQGAGAAGGGPPGFPVEVAVAKTDTVRDEIAATGQIEALQSIVLQPEVEGRIVAILFREGQEVAAGTPLFQIDSTELAAQVAQLAAQRDLAQQDLARTKELVAQNAASTSDLEHAEAAARSADAQYRLQSTRLARTTVRAPFGGIVGQRFVSLGDYVDQQHQARDAADQQPDAGVVSGPGALRPLAQAGAGGDVPRRRHSRTGIRG